MAFNFAQTFYLDPDAAKGASEVGISAIQLYFYGKPKETDNKSGIESPGCEISIVPVKYGVPIIDELTDFISSDISTDQPPVARREWGEIITSANGKAPTVFRFPRPWLAKTGYSYALVIRFDGDEDFILWSAKDGDFLIDTTTKFAGSSLFQGNFFKYISPTEGDYEPAETGLGYSNNTLLDATADDASIIQTDTSAPPSLSTADQAYIENAWKPFNNVDLKFDLFIASFADGGIPITGNTSYNNADVQFANITPTLISNNVMRIKAPSLSYEYIMFDRYTSNTDNLVFGDWFWQEAPAWPGGTDTPMTVGITNGSVNVVANSSYLLANGDTFNAANGWNAVYDGLDNEYIVINSGDDVFVRKIISIVSNTVLIVDEEIPETNTVATFYKAPVGKLYNKSTTYVFGLEEETAMLSETNANATVRFVNNSITAIAIANDGIGYSNSDYLEISGFENVTGKIEGGYVAVANLVTNATGHVQEVHLANLGCGFANASWLTGANIAINNSSGLAVPAATANGAEFTFTTGCNIRGEFSAGNNVFANCRIVNMPLNQVNPEIQINNPVGTGFVTKFGTSYYKTDDANVISGEVIYGSANAEATEQVVKLFNNALLSNSIRPILPSRSNEYVTHFANGDLVNPTPYLNRQYTDSCYYAFEISSNNDHTNIHVSPEIIKSHMNKFIINNDYTDEHTNYGNAYAKHVVTKVSFQEDRFAEDLLVYLTAYRPVGTDFKVYARIHNSKDSDAFDDKDWTLLEQTDGVGVFSSQADDTDFIELTYGFSNWPNAEFSQTNTITTESANATLISEGFDSNLAANDIVRIYSPLFPNNYVVDVISSVTNSTQIVMNNPIANDNVVGTMKIEKVEFPKQGFKYITDDNVVRYYNEQYSLFTTYDTFQIKVVMLSDDDDVIPKIDDIRAVGVTA